MHRHPPFRSVIAVSLALIIVFDSGARAQTDGNNTVDPPSRVGRMARLLGTVSFHSTGETDWRPAAMNYPVTSGDAFWTQPSSAAEVDMGQAYLALDQSTEFDVEVLDDRSVQATQPQGAIFLRVRTMATDDVYRIATPRGAVAITAPGAYEIVAGDADHPTTVTVVEGAARIDSTNASLTLAAKQTGRIEGASNFAISVVPALTDPFLAARLADERRAIRPVQATRVAPPAVVAAMTGGNELSAVGDWSDSPQYGAIWYPPVAKTWVPYRNGHWGYVAPWGWTWIDDASWGFAPSHYGRWVQEGPRWGWIPAERAARDQPRERPVYAPALVSFISIGVGVAIGTGRGDAPDRAHGSVGWVPLGPREAYVPPYKTSDRYARAVNVGNVTTINNVTNVTTVNNLMNRGAVTVVPVAAMTGSQPVAARAEVVTPQTLAGARSERGNAVQPTRATSGVTPVVAKTLELATPATPVPVRPAAPGPVMVPVASVPATTVQSPVAKRADPAPGAAVVRTEPVAAVPVAVALPVLRPPVSAAPAHPRAGGTVVGATPAALPAGTPAIPAPGPVAAPAAGRGMPVLPPAVVTPAPLGKPAEPAKPPGPPPSMPASGRPSIAPVPHAPAPVPPAVVVPAPVITPAEPPAASPGKPAIAPVPHATAPVPPAVVVPAPAIKPTEPPAPVAGKPAIAPVPHVTAPVPPAVVMPAPVIKPAGPPTPAPGRPPIAPVPHVTAPVPPAVVVPAPVVKLPERVQPAPRPPEPVQPAHAPTPPPVVAPRAAKPEMPQPVKPAEPPKPAVAVPAPAHAAEAPKPHGPGTKDAPETKP